MTDAVLALNAGSSSIKFGLFDLDEERRPKLTAKGLLEDKGDDPHLIVKDRAGAVLEDRRWKKSASSHDALEQMLDGIEHRLGTDRLIGVGHRIVHGGREFVEPVRLDDETIASVERLTPLAPLHQPRSLELIRAMRKLRPDLPQVGCFDTAFHHTLASPVSLYAIPRRYFAEGVRKYGFHGLSYAYIAGRLHEIDPALSTKRAIVAHLGNGASLCALRDGRSVDTTMGFSALDGLVMGARCGAIDPGVVLYLQRVHHLSADAVERMLYYESGLLGVSGVSADMRALEASNAPDAKEAVDLFTFRIAREIAALASTLGGLELLVFTGGIGEHSATVRAAVCQRLAWLGARLDQDANARSAAVIRKMGTTIEVRVIATDEEIVIARHTISCLTDA
jgi:acetate kinase